MSKPSLDQIEVDILKTRLDMTLPKWKASQEDSQERGQYQQSIENDQRRYHQLTGRWYTFRHGNDYEERSGD